MFCTIFNFQTRSRTYSEYTGSASIHMIAADSSTFYIKQTRIIVRSLCVYRTSTVTRTVITDFCISFDGYS